MEKEHQEDILYKICVIYISEHRSISHEHLVCIFNQKLMFCAQCDHLILFPLQVLGKLEITPSIDNHVTFIYSITAICWCNLGEKGCFKQSIKAIILYNCNSNCIIINNPS